MAKHPARWLLVLAALGGCGGGGAKSGVPDAQAPLTCATAGCDGGAGEAGSDGAPAGAGANDSGARDAGRTTDGAVAGDASAEAAMPGDPLPADRAPRSQVGCPAATAEARALFDLPRAGDAVTDFYRLPFPNDARRVNGRLALADFPRPGVSLLGFDPVAQVADALTSEGLGFGLHPVVYFRFSRAPALSGAAGPDAHVALVDVTAGASEYGQAIAARWGTAPGGRYVCAQNLFVAPADWSPLLPGHTYAAIIEAGLGDDDGQPFIRDDDFVAIMSQTAPTGAARLAAWAAYAPLRDWLRATGHPAPVSAAVFTTDAVDRPVGALRAAVHATDLPAIDELVRCGRGVASPCDGERQSSCADGEADDRFEEYEGRLELPVFQQGTPPYETTGGGIAYDDAGRPMIQRREEVCFSLSVPKGPMPAAGWPMVVYSHGTGGSYRTYIESGVAADLAVGAIGGGPSTPMATFGYDGVLHGSRQGSSTLTTDRLVYNVRNPTAARDNGLQAAADLFAIARALPALSDRLPQGRALSTTRVGFYGHSQGGNAGGVGAGFEPTFGAVVLSGTGGGLTKTLLQKSKPVAIAGLLPVFLGETVTTTDHPALALMQMYFDPADPLTYARRLVATPPVGIDAHDLLHVYGADDHYAPDETQQAFADAAGLPVLHPVTAAHAYPAVAAPVRSNMQAGAARVTAVSAQYQPDGYDGHFVSTENPAARAAITQMLGSMFRDGVSEVE